MKRLAFVLLALASCEFNPALRADSWYRTALSAKDPLWALECIDQAIQDRPLAEYYEYRARLNLRLKLPDAALNDLGTAIGLQKNDPALHFSRGALLVRMGRAQEAAEDFSETLRLSPGHLDALLYRGTPKDLDEARRIGAAAADGYYNDGVRAHAAGESAEAERLYRFAIALRPDHSRAHLAIARLFMEKRRYAEAAEQFDQAIPEGSADASLYYHRGNARLAAGRGEEALSDFARAVELDPAEPTYLAARGLALQRVRNDVERARANFDEAIKMDPQCHPAWFNRGVLLHELKDLAGAERDLRRAGTIRASPEGCLALGRVLHDRGEFDKAVSLYRQALDLYRDPEIQKLLYEEVLRSAKAREFRK